VAAARRQYEAAAGLGDDGAAASPGEARRRYAELLERSGLQAGDVDWQLRTQLLQQRLVERAAREVEEPTDEEVRRFFRERPELFGGTASREVVLAVADDRDQARREERRLRAGEEGPATTVVRGAGFLPPAVERAVFAARRGEVVGPVEAGGRLYVARVVRVTEEGERPRFEDAAPEARQRLQAERTQRVQVEFQNGLQERWRPATLCADDLRVPQCRNGPEAAPLPVPGDEER
jgi:parvulin-like peptidyl-prolyl isomerase